jgi:hypothetical protein
LTGSEIASWVAGIIGAFWPVILSHHNSPNLNLIAWVPLALLFIRRTMERQRITDALIAAGFIALIGLTRWQLLIIGGILIALFMVYFLIFNPQLRNIRVFKLIILMGLVALLLMLPLLAPLVVDQLGRQDPSEIFTSDSNQTDLMGYFVPSRFHPLWGKAIFERFYSSTGFYQSSVPFLGFTTLALALYGTVKRWKQARFWLVAVLLLILLALGPELLINGRSIMPLPYRWLEQLFIFKIIRNPDRFNSVVVIPIAVLAGLGVTALWQHSRLRGRRGVVIIVILVGLILFEYVVRFPTLNLEVPAWYHQLAKEEDDFAIVDLPMGTRTHDEYYMRYQFVHGKSLVGGKVSRPTQEAFAFIDSVPLLQHARRNEAPPTNLTRFSYQFQMLNQANVRYLILHKDRFSLDDWSEWQQWLEMEPIHEDEKLAVYRTDWQLGQALPLNAMGLTGLGWVSSSLTPDSTSQDGWLTARVRWGSQTGIDQEYDVCFLISLMDSDNDRSFCQSLSPEWPTDQWKPNEVIDVSYPLHMDPFLESGIYEVAVTVHPTGDETPITEPLAIGKVAFSAIPRIFAGEESVESGKFVAKWADDIALTAVDVSQTDNQLVVALRWLALDRLAKRYKVFLHLIDEEDGSLVGQVDTAPRNWGYPTTWWEQNEIVDDTVYLPLDDIGPGRYQLWLGLSDEATGERLRIETTSSKFEGEAVDRLLLTTIER